MGRVRRRTRLIAGGALVVLASACLAGWLWWEREERQYREDIAALRSMGLPTNADELRALSRGTGTNGADFYRQANQLWEDIPPEESELLWNPKPNAEPEELARILEKHRATEERIVSLVRRASSSDYIDFELPWEEPNPLGGLTPMNVYPRLLLRRMNDKLKSGDTADAVAEFAVLVKMLDQLYAVPSFDIARRAAAWDSELYQLAAQPLLTAAQSDPELLRNIQKILRDRKPLLPAQTASKYEYVEQLSLFRSITDYSHLNTAPVGEEPQGPTIVDRLVVTSWGRRLVERSLASMWRRFWDSAPADPTQYTAFEKASLDRVRTISRSKSKTLSGYALTKLIGEGMAVYQYQGALTSRRLASLATEALLARALGSDPGVIITSSGPKGIDEYSRMPFVFKMNDRELLIYGFGPDKVDDLGRTKRNSLNPTTDITIRIPLKLSGEPKPSSTQAQ